MIIDKVGDMEIISIYKSNRKNKKYGADYRLSGEDKIRTAHFGDVYSKHFKDSTPLKLYSHLDHGDMKRLHAFYSRHSRNNGPASMLSKHYLW